MPTSDRTVHVLAVDESAGAHLKTLSEAGYLTSLHSSVESAQRRLNGGARPGVWLVPLDGAGEELMRWALEHAPAAHIIALVKQPHGESLHRAYELGARYCASTDANDVLRATEFALDGLDLAGSQTRLRPFAEPVEAPEHQPVRVLPAPRSA